MKNYLFILLCGVLLYSCSNEVLTPNLLSDEIEIDFYYFPKNTDYQIIDDLPEGVYFNLIEDLNEQGKTKTVEVLQNFYINDGENYRLKEEYRESALSFNTTRAAVSGFCYMPYLEGIGWSSYVALGQMAGTTGQSRRLEALMFSNPYYTTAFKARAYCEAQGWKEWVGIGDIVGNAGGFKRMEAIQLNIGSSFATEVYYRVYMEKIGWGAWVRNNEVAGTTGERRRIEAFQLMMVITP